MYEYGGVDYNGQAFAKTETQDEYGTVQGMQNSLFLFGKRLPFFFF